MPLLFTFLFPRASSTGNLVETLRSIATCENSLAETEEFIPGEKLASLPQRQVSWLRSWSNCLVPTIIIIAGLIAFFALAIFGTHRPSLKVNEVMISPCGRSAAEAESQGCHFDIMSFCWLPDACYDAELSDEFRAHNWEWFLDANQTESVPQAEALSGVHPRLFVNWEYHLKHCTYMWRKLHRAVLGKGNMAIDSYIGSYAHTRHCEHTLLTDREVGLAEVNTIIRVKYPDCGIS